MSPRVSRAGVQSLGLAASLLLSIITAAASATDAAKKPPGVQGSRESLNDAWLATDAVVVGTYRGVDSTLGPAYHVVDVDQVWTGTPARGRLVFKAPRGMRGERGTRTLLFLWDRLAGAPDGFLEESKARYGDKVWTPRSARIRCRAYLLPFPSYSYPFEKEKLVLRGQSAFLDRDLPLQTA